MKKKELLCVWFAWLYVIEATTFIIKSNVIDNIIQIICLFCMGVVSLFRKQGKIWIEKTFYLYFFLVIVTLIPDILKGNLMGVRIAASYLIPVILLLFIVDFYHEKIKLNKFIFFIPLLYGVAISISGIIIEVLNCIGKLEKTPPTFIEKTGTRETLEIHGLGACANWGKILGVKLVRIQGYYIEPSKMAAFLLIPIFIGWGIWKMNRSIWGIAASIVSLACLFLTMSRAGFVSLIGTMVIVVLICLKRKENAIERNATKRDLIRLFLGCVFFILCTIGLLNIMVYFGKKAPDLDFLYRGISNADGRANLVRSETVDIPYIIEIMAENPFGYGFYNMLHGVGDIDTNMANASTLWLISGGFLGFFIAICIVIRGILYYAIPAIKTNNPIKQSIAMCFIGLSIHSLSYGTWMTADYLLIYALLISQKNKEII